MSLHLTYRPTSFEEIRGNKGVLKSVKGELAKEKRQHSFLFHGPSGTGKTTVARIIAKNLGCGDLDIIEITQLTTGALIL